LGLLVWGLGLSNRSTILPQSDALSLPKCRKEKVDEPRVLRSQSIIPAVSETII
jgi:hypothetical protein